MIPHDTSDEAQDAQLAAYQRMTGERRVEIAAALSADVRAVALEGIKHRHPEYDQALARKALIRLIYGDAVARAIWPDDPLAEP